MCLKVVIMLGKITVRCMGKLQNIIAINAKTVDFAVGLCHRGCKIAIYTVVSA